MAPNMDDDRTAGLPSSQWRWHDLVALLGVASACAAAALHLYGQFDFLRVCRGWDLWFDSDTGRIVASLWDSGSVLHSRSNLHPLWSLLVATPVIVVRKIAQLSMSQTVAVYVALQGASLGGVCYVAMRGLGFRLVDALIGVMLLMSTSAFIYWIGLPEWLAFGAVSVVVCVAWLAAPKAFHAAPLAVMQGLISVSITVTHWALGVAALILVRWPDVAWRTIVARTRDTLALLALLSVVQVMIYPGVGRFLDIWYQVGGLNHAEHTVLEYSAAFFGHTLVAPDPIVLQGVKPEPGYFRIVSSVGVLPRLTPLTMVVFCLWSVLVGLGLWAAVRDAQRRPQFLLVAGSIVFFFALHMVYGVETFLFSIQFVPFFVFLALWGTTDRYRHLVRVLAVLLIAASAAYNYSAFQIAVEANNAVDPSWLEGIGEVSELTALTVCQ